MINLSRIKYSRKLQIGLGLILLWIIALIVAISLRLTAATDEISSPYLNNQVVDGLSFEEAKINQDNNQTTYTVKIVNDLQTAYQLKTIDVVFKNKSGATIETLAGYVGETIESGDEKYLEVATDNVIADIDKINYVIKK